MKQAYSESIMCTPPFWGGGGGGGGGGAPDKIFKRGGTGSQFLERGCWERGGDFFQKGGFSFYIKNKQKSEIFNSRKR